jgi:hypothetical protein
MEKKMDSLEGYRRELLTEAMGLRVKVINAVWQGRDPAELEPARLRLEVLDRKLAVLDRLALEREEAGKCLVE